MVNYYNAFLPEEKQARVICLTKQMNLKELTNLLPLPKSKYIRYVKMSFKIEKDAKDFCKELNHRFHYCVIRGDFN